MAIRTVALLLPLVLGGLAVRVASEAPTDLSRAQCSLIPAVSFRDTTVTAVLGRALPDTVLAGPGSIPRRNEGGHWENPRRNEGGHWGNGQRDTFYAQLVDVARLAGADSLVVEAHFAQHGHRRIAVVPWDYAPDCRPVPWSRSARWVEETSPGFYRLQLRAPAEWASGYPTFDALTADLQPYPHGLLYRSGYRGTDDVPAGLGLMATEYFDLYTFLPARHERDAQLAASIARLDAWLAANPTIAERYPATLTLRLLGRKRQDRPTPPANDH